jgi:CRISPR-associated protein Cas1
MTHQLLNVLYVQTQGALLQLDGDAVRVRVEGQIMLRAPLLRLKGLVLFGRVTITPTLIQRCAGDGRDVVWMSRSGRFLGRLQGAMQGNVLLRRAQHLALSSLEVPVHIARQMVAGKIQNCRQILLRAARERQDVADRESIAARAGLLADILGRLPSLQTLNELRGAEGEAARAYFEAFRSMVLADRQALGPTGRTRRPPRDPVNSVLSFLYALLRSECSAALETVGLDPQIGYLHALRPGRPALALDLMEELRPVLADRLALTLVNRGQLTAESFDTTPDGAVSLTEGGRRTAIGEYQRRKEVEVEHRVLKQQIPLGLVPHAQARLLARYLRGDLEHYPPFLYR